MSAESGVLSSEVAKAYFEPLSRPKGRYHIGSVVKVASAEHSRIFFDPVLCAELERQSFKNRILFNRDLLKRVESGCFVFDLSERRVLNRLHKIGVLIIKRQNPSRPSRVGFIITPEALAVLAEVSE